MDKERVAIIFFLLLKDRPKNFLPLKNFKGKFWHTGIILDNKIYECFNFGMWNISEITKLKKGGFKNAVFVDTKIKNKKILEELKNGTDCAEYVARCIGFSNLTGSNKGELWPEDIFNLLQESKNILLITH